MILQVVINKWSYIITVITPTNPKPKHLKKHHPILWTTAASTHWQRGSISQWPKLERSQLGSCWPRCVVALRSTNATCRDRVHEKVLIMRCFWALKKSENFWGLLKGEQKQTKISNKNSEHRKKWNMSEVFSCFFLKDGFKNWLK